MQLDQKTLAALLAMSDDQLGAVIQKIARDAGIDPAILGINPEQVESIRRALGSVTDRDLDALNELYRGYKQGKKP